MRKPKLVHSRNRSYQDLQEANETIRELMFKVNAYGVLVEFALANLPEDAKTIIGNGLFRLATGHIRDEHPLQWMFQGRTVRFE